MIAYDYLCEGVQKNRYTSTYIHQFTGIELLKRFRNFPNWRRFLNGKQLKKEVTECMAVVNRCLNLMNQLDEYLISDSVKTILIFDMCCGKGYGSVCLHALLPEHLRHKIKIIMLDRNNKINLEYLSDFKQSEIQFEVLCIYTEEKDGKNRLIKDIENKMKRYGKIGEEVISFCVGVHLCVYLSEMFIDLFNSMDSIWGMILSPCCHKENEHNISIYEMSRSSIFEDDDSEGMKSKKLYTIEHLQYYLWTFYLFQKIKAPAKRMINDANVMSPKNNYIVACKAVSSLSLEK
jgi:hypothetical protein